MINMSIKCYPLISSLWTNLFTVLVFKTVFTTAEIPQDKVRKLEEARIIPDYCTYFKHCVEAQINFEGKPRIEADFGNVLDARTLPTENPEIRWVAEVGEYYTVTLIDPDVRRNPPQPVEKMLWMVINVPGCWVFGGKEVIPYQKPENPTVEGEVHKIIALVYHQQDGQMNFSEPFLKSDEITKGMRDAFRIRKFAEKYKLMFPFAMNFFRVEYKDPKQAAAGQKKVLSQNERMKQQKQQKKKQQQQQRQKNQQQQRQQQQQKQQQQQQQKQGKQQHDQGKQQQDQGNQQQDQGKQQQDQGKQQQDQGKQEQGQGKQNQDQEKQQQQHQHQKQGKEHQDQHSSSPPPQRKTTVDPNFMDAQQKELEENYIAAQKQDLLDQFRRREEKQKHQKQHSPTATHHGDESEEVTLSPDELARRQAIIEQYRKQDQEEDEKQRPEQDIVKDKQKKRVWTIIATTDNPIRAIYMRDYREKQRRKREKRDRDILAGIWTTPTTIQMPDVPDWDEMQMDDYDMKPGPKTTMNPIQAIYMRDYKEKQRRKREKRKLENRTTTRTTIQMPIVPDWDEMETEAY